MRNYISKINDRNLQRKRESGLTTYALYSVLVLIMYKIVELYPSIPFKTKFWFVIQTLTYTSTIVFSSTFIVFIYNSVSKSTSSTRLVWKSKQKANFFERLIVASIALLPTITNISVVISDYLTKRSVNLYCLINSLLCSFLFIFTFTKYGENKQKSYYDIIEGTGSNEEETLGFEIISFLICLINIVFGFYNIYLQDSNTGKIDIFVFGVLLMIVPSIIDQINSLRQIDTFSNDLENLEYEINVMNLSDDQVRERLQKNYMGFLLSEWINYNAKELDSFVISFLKSKEDIEKMKEDLKEIDKNQYSIEYNGRSRNILKLEDSTKNSFEKFFRDKMQEIDVIIVKSTLNSNERGNLINFRFSVEREYNKYKS